MYGYTPGYICPNLRREQLMLAAPMFSDQEWARLRFHQVRTHGQRLEHAVTTPLAQVLSVLPELAPESPVEPSVDLTPAEIARCQFQQYRLRCLLAGRGLGPDPRP